MDLESEGIDAEPVSTREDLKRELADEKKQNGELLTRLRYAQADLENYRKRMDRELMEAGESMTKGLVKRLLVVQDELDLAVKHLPEGEENGEVTEGIKMVQRNLRSALEEVGVVRIDSVGNPFDPTVHEAVGKTQGDRDGPDLVVEEVRPGFMFRGQLLRPSMVKVELASKTGGVEAKLGE